MHDSVLLEKRGRPTAFIATAPYVITGETTAALAGIPSYQFASIEHPVGRLLEEGLRERAETVLPQVLKLLLVKRGD